MKKAWPWMIGVGAAFVGALALFSKTIRYPGDRAEVNDTVIVPAASYGGAAALGLPPGAGGVGIQVQSVTPDTFSGVVVSYLNAMGSPVALPLTVPVSNLPRANVSQVLRNGRVLG